MSDAIINSSLDRLSNAAPHDSDNRYADKQTAALYPLECQTAPLAFQQVVQADAPQTWRLEIPLPPIAANCIIIPSYTQLANANYRTQFELVANDGTSTLPSVPTDSKRPRSSTAVAASVIQGVSTHIDYWLLSKPASGLRLRLWLTGAPPSSRYLLNLCTRSQQLKGPLPTEELSNPDVLGLAQLERPLSQRLGPNAIRGGICSPTATAMAMAQVSPSTSHSWPNIVAGCRDGATGMYGVWPLNLYHASRLGHLGAIETPTLGSTIQRILTAQLPLVTSISYAAGALTHAPQPQTSGHLVMLHGTRSNKALVADPAAPSTAEVGREYPLEEFLEAWLRQRGACYLLLPNA